MLYWLIQMLVEAGLAVAVATLLIYCLADLFDALGGRHHTRHTRLL
jgi:hypothetical protein